MAIITGLMITFWGWNNWRGFFAHPARCATIAIFLIRFADVMWRMHPNMIGKGRDDKRVREPFFFALLYASLLVVLASPYFDARDLWLLPGGDGTRYTGLALFVFGLTLANWAQRHLGRFFSGHVTLQEDHRLIMDGPFTYIRHPRYAGGILLFLGLPLVFRSAVGAAAGICCAALLFVRIRREEALMAREFGAEWTAYARRTKRLLPAIY
jgi:protein-S-isoprenylcysteine O-methyltransferase Ste14